MAHFQKSQKATYGFLGPKTSKNYVKIREHMAGYIFFDFEKNIYKYIINELIRINFMPIFGLLKSCHRLWVTFHRSAATAIKTIALL